MAHWFFKTSVSYDDQVGLLDNCHLADDLAFGPLLNMNGSGNVGLGEKPLQGPDGFSFDLLHRWTVWTGRSGHSRTGNRAHDAEAAIESVGYVCPANR